MKKHTLLTGALTAVMAFTGLAQAQSSARQERFEAFVQARLTRAELPISALTRRQQANFGVAALILAEEEINSFGESIFNLFSPEQAFTFLGSGDIDGIFLRGLANLSNQRIDLVRSEPRRNSRELTTIRAIRRSGLLFTGNSAERFDRPEFTVTNLRDEIERDAGLDRLFTTLGTFVTTAEANERGALIAASAIEFFNFDTDRPFGTGIFPEDFTLSEATRIYQAIARRAARTVRELLAINPNFNPLL